MRDRALADSERLSASVRFRAVTGRPSRQLPRLGCAISRLFAIDGIPNCACHQAPMPTLLLRGWEPNDAATLWELQIASDAMSLDA